MTKKQTHRYELLDFLRGIAIGLMLVYHFCFGLKVMGIINASFSSNYFWMSFRSLIIFLFLSLMGIGLVLATRKKRFLKSYFKRLTLLFVYMLSISWLSYQVLPERYVFFGILHLIFVSSILGLFFVRAFWLNLFLGLAILLVGNFLTFPLFNHSKLLWVGLNTIPVYSNDFAPLLPWFGLVLIGIFMGRLLLSNPQLQQNLNWKANHWITRLVTLAGRYSLHIYFIHFQGFYVLIYFFG